MKRAITALLLLCALVLVGCGLMSRPSTVYIYCSETFWNVMQEEAVAFHRLYGNRVILIPIRAPRTSAVGEDVVEFNSTQREISPWRSMPGAEAEEPVPQYLGDSFARVNPEIERLINWISEDRSGDLFLSDSRRQLEKLYVSALSADEFVICYLTLTMLVPQRNPLQLNSVKEVLESNRRLGIVNPSLDGLGEASWTVLSRIVPGGESEIPMRLVHVYERQYDLLEALEQGHIDAALLWNAASHINFLMVKYADEYNITFARELRVAARSRNQETLRRVKSGISTILIEEKSFAEEVPLTENPDERFVIAVRLVVLSSASNYDICQRFADFLRSHRGKESLRRFGFVPE